MKKTFVNPEMNISLFEMENVLTVSGGDNMKDAEAAMGTGAAVTKVNFKDLDFVL